MKKARVGTNNPSQTPEASSTLACKPAPVAGATPAAATTVQHEKPTPWGSAGAPAVPYSPPSHLSAAKPTNYSGNLTDKPGESPNVSTPNASIPPIHTKVPPTGAIAESSTKTMKRKFEMFSCTHSAAAVPSPNLPYTSTTPHAVALNPINNSPSQGEAIDHLDASEEALLQTALNGNSDEERLLKKLYGSSLRLTAQLEKDHDDITALTYALYQEEERAKKAEAIMQQPKEIAMRQLEQELAALKKYKERSEKLFKEMNNIAQCPICQEVAVSPKIVGACGHIICQSCQTSVDDVAFASLQNNGAGASPRQHLLARRCPLCRVEIIGDGFKVLPLEKIVALLVNKERVIDDTDKVIKELAEPATNYKPNSAKAQHIAAIQTGCYAYSELAKLSVAEVISTITPEQWKQGVYVLFKPGVNRIFFEVYAANLHGKAGGVNVLVNAAQRMFAVRLIEKGTNLQNASIRNGPHLLVTVETDGRFKINETTPTNALANTAVQTGASTGTAASATAAPRATSVSAATLANFSGDLTDKSGESPNVSTPNASIPPIHIKVPPAGTIAGSLIQSLKKKFDVVSFNSAEAAVPSPNLPYNSTTLHSVALNPTNNSPSQGGAIDPALNASEQALLKTVLNGNSSQAQLFQKLYGSLPRSTAQLKNTHRRIPVLTRALAEAEERTKKAEAESIVQQSKELADLKEYKKRSAVLFKEMKNIAQCPICQEVAILPKTVGTCGHIICQSCLTKQDKIAFTALVSAGASGSARQHILARQCPLCPGEIIGSGFKVLPLKKIVDLLVAEERVNDAIELAEPKASYKPDNAEAQHIAALQIACYAQTKLAKLSVAEVISKITPEQWKQGVYVLFEPGVNRIFFEVYAANLHGKAGGVNVLVNAAQRTLTVQLIEKGKNPQNAFNHNAPHLLVTVATDGRFIITITTPTNALANTAVQTGASTETAASGTAASATAASATAASATAASATAASATAVSATAAAATAAPRATSVSAAALTTAGNFATPNMSCRSSADTQNSSGLTK